MNVLFITSAYPADVGDPRGAFIHELAAALTRQGIRITVLAPGTPAAPQKESRDGVVVQRATYWLPRGQRLATGFEGIVPTLRRRPWLALQVPSLVAGLAWQARRLAQDADIVHGHWLYPGGLAGALAISRSRVPLVVTSHGTDLALARRFPPLRWLSRWVGRRAAALVGVSHAVVEGAEALGIGGPRVRFIPLGVSTGTPPADPAESAELRRFRERRGFGVVYVGRLVPGKSVETLLHALAALQRRGRTVAAALVGSGPEQPGLEALARSLGLTGAVFVGAQPPAVATQWTAAAHALVLPSRSEGRGIVILEAMALGVPAVACDIPGPKELIRHQETGMLFPSGDAAALAACLEQLMDDDGRRREMGRRARAFVVAANLTAEQSARAHVELYRELLRAGRS
ncbi:MAG: glycosyltransferase [Gemmatimonadetes bacterium]|nr:glycosyltransferase [Gemmatimonadota bacterium]